MDPRSVQLEEKVAYLEQHIAELDGVVREMNDRMDRFAREAKGLRTLVEALQEGPGDEGTQGGDLEDERPPHW